MPKLADPPVIKTTRLILAPHTVADFDDCYAMWSDPHITRFIGGKPSSCEDVWLRMLRYTGLWSLLGFGYWVIRERQSGMFLGEAGLADFHRDITPSLGPFPELGFALAHSAWGKGYATEAARAIIAWSDENLKHTRLVALADSDNRSSIRVLSKCEFKPGCETIYKLKVVTLYAR